MNVRGVIFGVALAITAGKAQAQVAQRVIPIRQLSVAAHSDSLLFSSIASVRQLKNGSVLVNDAAKRQLVVFDSSLLHPAVIADTSSRGDYAYGLRAKNGALIPYLGDSTMFADDESSIFLVIDPAGKIVNVIAPVRGSDLKYITSGLYGGAGFDTKGRLIYGSIRYVDLYKNLPGIGQPAKTAYLADSAPILRADFDERTVDTIAFIQVPVQKSILERTSNGGATTFNAFNPLPSGDDWTLLPDGTIAIVRARDYHIDWITPDGKLTSSPRMSFDWRAISADDKKHMIDSVRYGLQEAAAKDFADHPPLPGAPVVPRLNFIVDPSDIPDFYPPVRQNSTRADLNGNVWILPATSVSARGGLLYDVVNREGTISERVQLPAGRALVGFGQRNTVYLSNVLAPNSVVLERAEIVR